MIHPDTSSRSESAAAPPELCPPKEPEMSASYQMPQDVALALFLLEEAMLSEMSASVPSYSL